jgi:hypothetical protein
LIPPEHASAGVRHTHPGLTRSYGVPAEADGIAASMLVDIAEQLEQRAAEPQRGLRLQAGSLKRPSCVVGEVIGVVTAGDRSGTGVVKAKAVGASKLILGVEQLAEQATANRRVLDTENAGSRALEHQELDERRETDSRGVDHLRTLVVAREALSDVV